MSEAPETPREIRFTPDPKNVGYYACTNKPTEEHFCRACQKVTTHVMSSTSFMDGRDELWPEYRCQYCGTKVPENPAHFCCRKCDPDMFALLDQGMTPQAAAMTLASQRRLQESEQCEAKEDGA